MAAEFIERLVKAPPDDWLTKDQVLEYLGNPSETTLNRMIAEGRFPRSVKFPAGRKWRWVDIAWWRLGQEILDRLELPEEGAEDEVLQKPPKTSKTPPGDSK